MKSMKIRLAVFLSIIMVLPTIIAVLPTASVSVSAASTYVYMYWAGAYEGTEIEQGQQFYVGDYVGVSIYGKKSWMGTASSVSASYSSSKPSVASVDNKGYLTANAPGKTKITVKYSGEEVTKEIEVVASGTFAESAAISGLRERADKLAQKMPSKVTVKNGYTYYKLAAEMKSFYNKNKESISIDGYIMNGTDAKTSQLAVPQAGRYKTFTEILKNNFGDKNNPTSTRSAKVLRISSMSAKSNAITVKLKKKVDATQVLAARICNENAGNEEVQGTDKAYISISIFDVKKYDMYEAVAEIKKGSKIMTIKSIKKYKSSANKYVNAKLKKGRTYRLDYGTDNWTKGKTVKVK